MNLIPTSITPDLELVPQAHPLMWGPLEMTPALREAGVHSGIAIFYGRLITVVLQDEKEVIGNGSSSSWPDGPHDGFSGLEKATQRALKSMDVAREKYNSYWRQKTAGRASP